MKRFAALLCVILFACVPAAEASESFAVAAKGAVLIEGASGRILYAQNADEAYPMASTTKLMTCLLGFWTAALMCGCGPSYQYRKPSRSTVSPMRKLSTA